MIKGSFEKRFYLTVLCFDTLHWYGVLAQSIGEDALVEVVSRQGRTVCCCGRGLSAGQSQETRKFLVVLQLTFA